jgi:hypothetical protein
VKKIPNLLILFISFNFLSCLSIKYYDVGGRYSDKSEYFYIRVTDLSMDEKAGNLFLILYIENKNKTKIGKTITIEEIKIITKDITYDMKFYIDKISFSIKNSYDWYDITNQEMNNFFGTNSIDVPAQTNENFFECCTIYGINPGINYSKYSGLTLSFKINIELEDGTIEQIVFNKYGKRKHLIIPLFFVNSV